jgi:hypothetical protein
VSLYVFLSFLISLFSISQESCFCRDVITVTRESVVRVLRSFPSPLCFQCVCTSNLFPLASVLQSNQAKRSGRFIISSAPPNDKTICTCIRLPTSSSKAAAQTSACPLDLRERKRGEMLSCVVRAESVFSCRFMKGASAATPSNAARAQKNKKGHVENKPPHLSRARLGAASVAVHLWSPSAQSPAAPPPPIWPRPAPLCEPPRLSRRATPAATPRDAHARARHSSSSSSSLSMLLAPPGTWSKRLLPRVGTPASLRSRRPLAAATSLPSPHAAYGEPTRTAVWGFVGTRIFSLGERGGNREHTVTKHFLRFVHRTHPRAVLPACVGCVGQHVRVHDAPRTCVCELLSVLTVQGEVPTSWSSREMLLYFEINFLKKKMEISAAGVCGRRAERFSASPPPSLPFARACASPCRGYTDLRRVLHNQVLTTT